ncbi:MAG: AAA family ATPase [Anaerolineaceae bacterium]|nr:AAA family ATPase [Anaerolineaceae bacterium]
MITGGPCAGKTTAMNWIQNAFTNRGYMVLFVPETAAEMISGGVSPLDMFHKRRISKVSAQTAERKGNDF